MSYAANPLQALIDLGVNGFGALIFAESIAGCEAVAKRSADKPVTFELPVRMNRGQTNWRAVRFTFEAVPAEESGKPAEE